MHNNVDFSLLARFEQDRHEMRERFKDLTMSEDLPKAPPPAKRRREWPEPKAVVILVLAVLAGVLMVAR